MEGAGLTGNGSVSQRSKILVVDDEPVVVEILEKMLRKRDFEVITAADGNECMALAQSASPNLILLDLLMPNKDGWQVLKELKANKSTRNIPVFCITALGAEEEVNRSKMLGAKEHFVKPFDFSGLLRYINIQLGNYGALPN
jgi:DNA-binding response OmpR family regulator